MRSTLVLCLALTALAAHAAPKVAVIYSSWPQGQYGFRDEFDPHLKALGWAFEKFENVDLPKLLPRLGEFDLVIAAGVANYEHTVDMLPHKDAWLAWLRHGGALWITDASYPTALDQWVNRLGPDFALTSATCAFHRRDKPEPEKVTFDAVDPLLQVPVDARPLLAAKTNLWAHLDSWGPVWHSLATCADAKSFLLYREVDRGAVLVSSYFSFQGDAATPVAAALLTNLWTHVQGLRSGVALTELNLGGELPGSHQATLGLRNAAAAPTTLTVKLSIAGEAAGAPSASDAAVTLPPGGEARLRLPYRLTGRGEVLFDLAVSAANQPAYALHQRHVILPAVALRAFNRHLYPWNTSVALPVAFAPESSVALADCRARVLLDGQTTAELASPPAAVTLTAPLGTATLGPHKLAVALLHGDEVIGTAESTVTRHTMPRIHTRPEDGTTLVDGKPFFPFGWYHVSWSFTAEDRMQCLRDIAAAGFNTIHASLKQMDEWDPFLTEAEKLHVMVLTEFGVDSTQAIKRYRGRPPVLAWNPGDEPDGGGTAPETMLERHNALKDLDPEVPTYMTLCRPDLFARYVGAAEVIAPDPYPIRRDDAHTATVYDVISRAQAEAGKYGHPIWAILQAFGYTGPGWRVPTFAEERNMTYLALLAGAKGIVYYTYRDTGFDMAKEPALWAQFKSLPPEIHTLERWLLDGTRTPLSTGRPDLFAGLWRQAGRTVLVVVNSAADGPREVDLAVPADLAGQPVALFAGQPITLHLAAGRLTGTMGPLGVQVCELK